MIKKRYIKTIQGENIYIYKLINSTGCSVKMCNYGATVLSLLISDKKGNYTDVVLGYSSIDEYIDNRNFLGVTIGPFANRISGGNFTIGDKHYSLKCNENGINLLHSGAGSYANKVWDGIICDDKLVLSLNSSEEKDGFPGNKKIKLIVSFSDNNHLRFEYFALSDQDTFLSMTNHSYFNLRGNGLVLDHILKINANNITPINSNLIPTGEYMNVDGTPFDFRQPKEIGLHINDDFNQIKIADGYDHNFVLNGSGFRKVAEIMEPVSERKMQVYTDMPGMQFYTSNALKDVFGRNGEKYVPRCAYCFETQFFPDCMNHNNLFPSCFLEKGEEYSHVTEYRFL